MKRILLLFLVAAASIANLHGQCTTNTPIVYNPSLGCVPTANICPVISGLSSGWSITSMIITFPNGSTYDVNQELAFGLPIDQALLDAVTGGVFPCINTSDIYSGNPNGQWSISIVNGGSGYLHLTIPAHSFFVDASTCTLLANDQYTPIPAQPMEVFANDTDRISYCVPVMGNGSGNPVISSVVPTPVCGSEPFYIYGSGFNGTTAISLGPVAGGADSFLVLSDNILEVYFSPAVIGPLDIIVYTHQGPVSYSNVPNGNFSVGTTTSASTICAGQSTTISAFLGTSYLWSTGATTGSITVNPTATTTYSVTVYNGSCGLSASRQITVNNCLSIDLGSNQTICMGNFVPLQVTINTGTGPYNYNWSSNGSGLSCNNCSSPFSIVGQNTTYSVTVTDALGNTATDSITYTVYNCNGTCSPDPTATLGEIKPDCTNWQPIIPNQYYNQSFTFHNFDSVTINGIKVRVDYMYLDSINNLPCGIAWGTNKTNNYFDNSELGCVLLGGTTNDALGQYNLTFKVRIKISLLPNPIPYSLEDLGHFNAVRVCLAPGANCPAINSAATGIMSTCNSGNILVVSPTPPLQVSLGNNQTVCPGSSVSLQPTVTGGTLPYTYLWSSSGNALSCYTCANPTTTVNNSSTFSVTVTDANGDFGSSAVTYTVNNPSVNITANGPTTFCTGGSVGLSVAQALGYQWSTGETTQSITVDQAGTYSVTVNTGGACVAVGSVNVTVVPQPATQSIVGNLSIIPLQSYSYQVTLNPNTTYWWAAQGGAIQSGQGSQQVSVLWGNSGPYALTLVYGNAGGCTDTVSVALVNSTCSLPLSVSTVSSSPVCQGDTVLLIGNGGANATYQWYKDGTLMLGYIGDSLTIITSGTYQVQAASGGCTAISSGNVVSFQQAPLMPIITGTANVNGCNTQPVTLGLTNSYPQYLWSTGGTGPTIMVSGSGSFMVTVTASNGCQSVSAPFNLNQSVAAPPAICLVSVDSATGKNIVVWEKNQVVVVDSYFVYKETSQFNVFSKIGGIGVNDFSTFVDLASNPRQQADRYKIAILDTCGNLTVQSNPHKTMHLTINQGLGNAWNLIWSHYEGFAFGSYNIYRGTTPANLTLIGSISSGNNSFTDLSPPSGLVYYQVSVVNPNGCNPTAKAGDYGSSFSNIVVTGPDGVAEIENQPTIKVYPNPSTGTFVVLADVPVGEKVKVWVTDITGSIVWQRNGIAHDGNQYEIHLENIAAGLYYIHIASNDGDRIGIGKVIKQ